MSSMVGGIAGSVIGHGVSRAIFGGHGGNSESAASPDNADPQSIQSSPIVAADDDYNSTPGNSAQDRATRCQPSYMMLNDCLKRNNNNMDSCSTFLDTFNACYYDKRI